MKRLCSKKGFTLVECVVAMAVLAVMTLGLLMILNITVKTRNSNMAIEQEVDRQVQEVVQGENVTTEAYEDPIEFKDADNVDGETLAEIPGGDVKGVTANKEFQENASADVEIGRLDYDFSKYEGSGEKGDGDGGGGGGASRPWDNCKVYGAITPDGGVVTVTETGATLGDDNYYTVRWIVDFKVQTGSDEKGLKVVFPMGTSDITEVYNNGCCKAVTISQNTVRIQPLGLQDKNVNFTWPTPVNVAFTFRIYKDDYDEYGGNLSQYFTEKGSGNSVSVKINHDYTA